MKSHNILLNVYGNKIGKFEWIKEFSKEKCIKCKNSYSLNLLNFILMHIKH